MSEKSLFVCLDCHGFFSGNPAETDCRKCPSCGGDTEYVPIDYEEYSKMGKEEKRRYCMDYAAKHCRKKPEPFQPIKESRMAETIGCFGGVMIALAIVGGAVIMITGGIVAGVAALIGGLTSGGILYVLSNIAQDVRHTRNQVDRLMHERKYKK